MIDWSQHQMKFWRWDNVNYWYCVIAVNKGWVYHITKLFGFVARNVGISEFSVHFLDPRSVVL